MPDIKKSSARTIEEQQRRMRIVSDAIENYLYTTLRDPETRADQDRKEVLMDTLAEMSALVYAPAEPVVASVPESAEPAASTEVPESVEKKSGGKK